MAFGLFALSVQMHAQFIAHPMPPIVVRGADTLTNAWGGGLWAPHFSHVDFDLDGDLDLVAFERANDHFTCWEWNGSRWIVRPDWRLRLPRVTRFGLFRDYTGDGKHDLFAGAFGGGVQAFKNTSAAAGHFQLTLTYAQVPTYMYSPSILSVPGTDLPAFEDIDGDGDLDFLSFYLVGSTIHLHRNLAVEQNQPLDSLIFDFDDQCWGKFQESSTTNQLILNVSCPPVLEASPDDPQPEHAGSTVTLFDRDGDGDFDLLLGDISYPNIVYAHNGKEEHNHPVDSMVYWQDSFPSTHPMRVNLFPAASVIDADHDQRPDIVIAPALASGTDNIDQVHLYSNTAASGFNLQFTSPNWLQSSMIDHGGYASPTFMDIDGDGDQDLLVAALIQRNGQGSTRINAYENRGGSPPTFVWIDSNFANLADTAWGPWTIQAADIDGDGDQDLFIGSIDGRIRWFKNIAPPGQPAQFVLADDTLGNRIFSGRPSFDFADVNLDGKLDLLVLSPQSYQFFYFRNEGTATAPDFQMQTDDFTGGVEDLLAASSFAIGDIDGDGLDDMVFGSWAHPLMRVSDFRSQIGNFTIDTLFHTLDQHPLYIGGIPSLEFTTITGDSLPALMAGLGSGGVVLLKNTNTPVNVRAAMRSPTWAVFPNPAIGNEVTLRSAEPILEVTVYAPDGRRVLHRRGHRRVWHLHLPRGNYVVHVTFPDRTAARRIVVQ